MAKTKTKVWLSKDWNCFAFPWMITVHQTSVFTLQLQSLHFVRGTSTRKMTLSRSVSRKVSTSFCLVQNSFPTMCFFFNVFFHFDDFFPLSRWPHAQTEQSSAGSRRHPGQVQEHQEEQPEWRSRGWNVLRWDRRWKRNSIPEYSRSWSGGPHSASLTDICIEDGVHDSSRDDALQNISADDLLDSASQTAQQHDSKFSFRFLSCSQRTS